MYTYLDIGFNLEESLQVSDLENDAANNNYKLSNAPPFDTVIGALSGVTMSTFTDTQILRLVRKLVDHTLQNLQLTVDRVVLAYTQLRTPLVVYMESDILVALARVLVAEAEAVTARSGYWNLGLTVRHAF